MSLTGVALKDAVATADSDQVPLVEEFLYEKDVMMIAGDPGVGKSILATQLALQMTSATRVWDFLNVPTPRKVYYLQLEGKPEQAYERIRRMGEAAGVKWNPTLLCWDARKGLNVLDVKQVEGVLNDILDWGKPDMVAIDPIYKAVFGPLAKEEPAQALIRFSDLIQVHFNASVLLMHHTHRASYGADGKKVDEDDPFYGSQWLKAHVDTGYLLRHPGGRYKDRVTLYNKKTRGSDVLKELMLHYDPDSDTVSVDAPPELQSGYERVWKFLQVCKKEGRTTDFFEVQDVCHVSSRQLVRLAVALQTKGHLRRDKSLGKKKIWEPI